MPSPTGVQSAVQAVQEAAESAETSLSSLLEADVQWIGETAAQIKSRFGLWGPHDLKSRARGVEGVPKLCPPSRYALVAQDEKENVPVPKHRDLETRGKFLHGALVKGTGAEADLSARTTASARGLDSSKSTASRRARDQVKTNVPFKERQTKRQEDSGQPKRTDADGAGDLQRGISNSSLENETSRGQLVATDDREGAPENEFSDGQSSIQKNTDSVDPVFRSPIPKQNLSTTSSPQNHGNSFSHDANQATSRREVSLTTEHDQHVSETSGGGASKREQTTQSHNVVGIKSENANENETVRTDDKKHSNGSMQLSARDLMPPPQARPVPIQRTAAMPDEISSTPAGPRFTRTLQTPSTGRFQVDENGKVCASALGALNEICSTPLVANAQSQRPGLSAMPSSTRSSRLYAQTRNIYSSLRKPAHGRVLKPQSSSNAALDGKRLELQSLATRPLQATSAAPGEQNSTAAADTGASLSRRDPLLRAASGTAAAVAVVTETAEQDQGTTSTQSKPPQSASTDLPRGEGLNTHSSSASVGKWIQNSGGADNSAEAGAEAAVLLSKQQGMRSSASLENAQNDSEQGSVERDENTGDLTNDGHDQHGEAPKTAPLKIARRPRIVVAKSALRSRMEQRRMNTASSTGMAGGSPAGHSQHSADVEPTTDTESLYNSAREDTWRSERTARFASPEQQAEALGRSSPEYGTQDQDDTWGSRDAESSRDPGDRHDSRAHRASRDPPAESAGKRESEGSSESAVADDPDPPGPPTSALGNLMTSITSFLPSARPRKEADAESKEASEERAAAAAKLDAERREAEVAARREAARLAKQREILAKQRRAEAKRLLIAREDRIREEERRRKEAERARKLREAEDEKQRQREEEDRKRETKRRRVEEHQRRIAEEEAERRRAIERKERAQRERVMRAKGPTPLVATSANSFGPPSYAYSTKSRTKSILKQKAPAPESYEMSAGKNERRDDSSDSEEERARRRRKHVPGWARSANLPHALSSETRDPDTIFERVHTLNLDEVFEGQTMKKRFRARTSSGAWVRDRLTAQEEMQYKKAAGFIRPADTSDEDA